MIDWNKVFSTDFFFGLDRSGLYRSDWAILLFGGLLILLAIILMIVKRLRGNPVAKELLAKLVRLLITIGLLEVFWFGMRYQYVTWLGTRVVAVAIGVIGLIWLGFIIKYYFKTYRVQRQTWEKEQMKLKYLQPQK